MPRKILIICVDGLGPEYLEMSATPNIDRMAEYSVVGRSVVPSVTNVNNVSVITGTPPRVHGITSNYWLDKATGAETFMESPEFLCCPTVIQRARRKGLSTALLTSKKKLLRLLDTGADYSLAAEDPDAEMMRKVGPKEEIYSAEINLWLFRALRQVLAERDPDVAYCTTTDWMMHKFAPEEEPSILHIQGLDTILGEVLSDNPDREIYLTADHGMSPKTRGVDIEKILESQGIGARAIPIIKDRYVAHHQNLGGASHVYLEDPDRADEATGILQSFPGIESIYPREETAQQFDLMAERIGDLFVLGDRDTVFGTFDAIEVPVEVRSHGSEYESAIPIVAYGRGKSINLQRNFDIVAQLEIDSC